ncbi:MAG: polysaccharide biosynthesis tyrosine autokinase [Chloroflexota bacterium]
MDFFDTIWRRKWIIAATIVLAVIIAFIGNIVIKPVYTASGLVRVSASPNPLVDRADLGYVQTLMNTYTIIGNTKPILSQVITELNLKISSSQLSDMIEIKAIADTELIKITVNGPDAEQAANIVNKLANALISETDLIATSESASQAIKTQMDQVQQELTDMRTEYDSLVTDSPDETNRIAELSREVVIKQQSYESLLAQYDKTRLSEAFRVNSISLIEPATPPRTPTTPRKTLNLVLGAVLGLLGGMGLVLFLSNVDRKIYGASQVKSILNLPVMAELGRFSKSQMKFSNLAPSGREGYRRLRAGIFSLQQEDNLKTLMVTSPDNDEGKSTVVYNLAMSIAQLGRTVLVIDGDMRQPCQHSLFELPNTIGLSTVLERKVSISEAIQETTVPGLHLLSSGPTPQDPPQLLATAFMRDTLRELAPKFDIILLDTPAAVPVVDTTILAPLADGVLLVVRLGKSQRDALLATRDQIDDVQAHLIGVVLNEASVRPSPYHSPA